MTSIRARQAFIFCLASLLGSSYARLLVFEGFKEGENNGDGFSVSRVGGGTYVLARGQEASSSAPRSISSLFSNPISWMYEQLEAIDDMQRDALDNALLHKYEADWGKSLEQSSASSKQRPVGCNKYREAIKEYMQESAQKALVAALRADGASKALESDADDSADSEPSLSGTSDEQASGSFDQQQRRDSQDDDEHAQDAGDGWGSSMGGSVFFLGSGVVAGQSVGGGSTRDWSSAGSTREQDAQAEELEAAQDNLDEKRQEEQLQAAGTSEAVTSALFNLLARATGSSEPRSRTSTPFLYLLPQREPDNSEEAQLALQYADEYADGGEFDDTDDPVAAAASAYWAKRRSDSGSSSTTSTAASYDTYYAMAGDTLFNAVFSLFNAPPSTDDVLFAQDLAAADDGDQANSLANIDAGLWQQQNRKGSGGQPAGALRYRRPAGPSTGLDLDFDGQPELDLQLYDEETGEVNIQLLLLMLLLLALAVMVGNFIRSWVQLRAAMTSSGHVLMPVTFSHNGRMCRGHLLVPSSDAGCKEGREVSAGSGLYTALDLEDPKASAKKQESELPEVVVASDFAAAPQQKM